MRENVLTVENEEHDFKAVCTHMNMEPRKLPQRE